MQKEGTDMAPLPLLVPRWLQQIAPARPLWQLGFCLGYTLIELLVSLALVATLTGIAVPLYKNHLETVAIEAAIIDIHELQREIALYEGSFGQLPANLGDINRQYDLDPWGNPYQYMNLVNAPKDGSGKPKGSRRDKFWNPLNYDYDLYSWGPDEKTAQQLTAKNARDDIVRAGEGQFVGVASDH